MKLKTKFKQTSLGSIPEDWESIAFSELCDITRGASPRPIHDWFADSGIPWIKIADATRSDSRFIDSTKQHIRSEGRLMSVVVHPGDLILSNSATPGIPKFVNIEACIHDGWLLLRKFNKLDKKFAYYLLINERPNIVQFGSGSIFTNLKTEILKNHTICLPPLPTQHRIAEILSSLDDKIELNRKMNKTLESIAQATFKEWFVGFRFPGYEKVKMVESEMGKIPEGWGVGTLKDEFVIVMGQSPKGSSYNEVGDGIIFFQGSTDFGDRFPTVRLFTTEPKRIAEKFDVLISVRAPVGDINVALDKCCIGRGVAAVHSDRKSYALYKMRSLVEHLRRFNAEGTVFGSVNKTSLENIITIMPGKEVINTFEKCVNEIDKEITTVPVIFLVIQAVPTIGYFHQHSDPPQTL
ncbi:hypothetical protein A2291_04275, partial [candidate division WOR-1 bacterium RIFOXYB2_FULL_42_35]